MKRKRTQFRLTGGTIFLTYPKCGLTKERALELLQEKVASKERTLIEYLVAQEKHKDGSDHLHAYLKMDQGWNNKDQNFWDLENHHGNYQGCRSSAAVKKYCLKEGNWLGSEGVLDQIQGPWGKALALAREGKKQEALTLLEEGGEKTARDSILYRETLTRSLGGLAPILELPCARGLENYPDLFHWQQNRFTLILFGETNRGKTSLAASLLPRALLTRHLDPLAAYSEGRHSGIILDDMSFHHLHDEAQIALLDVELSTQVHVRYRVADIPAGTPRILTTNRLPCDILRLSNPAIARRVMTIKWLGWDSKPMWENWGTTNRL